MYKKIMSLMCATVMLLTVAGCTSGKQPVNSNLENSSKEDTVSDNNTSGGNSSVKDTVSYYDYDPNGNDGWLEVDNSSVIENGSGVTTSKEFDLKSIKQLVFPKYNSSYTTTLALRELQSVYKSKAKLSLNIVKDNAGTKDYELLVGRTSRTTTKKISDVSSYTISWKGNKLMIDGGSPKAINAAISVLAQKVQNGEYILKKAFVGKCSDESGKAGEYTESLTEDFTGSSLSNLWRRFTGSETSVSYDGKAKTNVTMDTANLCQVKDGKLYQKVTLNSTSKEGDVSVYNVSRPKLSTQNKFWFQYGYTEASIKVAKGKGIGSAYWLHGKNAGLGSVYCEYDIVEIYGNAKYNQYSPLAWEVVKNGDGVRNESDWYLDTPTNTTKEYRTASAYYLDNFASLGDEYHTFGLEWDENYYRFTFDGEVIKTVKYTDMPEVFKAKDNFTKEEMINAYRQPVYAIFDMGCAIQTWQSTAPYGISSISGNNWVDDNICAFDYLIVYQKAGQVNGKTYEEVKQKMK